MTAQSRTPARDRDEDDYADTESCWACFGTGIIDDPDEWQGFEPEACDECNGTGFLIVPSATEAARTEDQ